MSDPVERQRKTRQRVGIRLNITMLQISSWFVRSFRTTKNGEKLFFGCQMDHRHLRTIVQGGPRSIRSIRIVFDTFDRFDIRTTQKFPNANFEGIKSIVPGFFRIGIRFERIPGRLAQFAQKVAKMKNDTFE